MVSISEYCCIYVVWEVIVLGLFEGWENAFCLDVQKTLENPGIGREGEWQNIKEQNKTVGFTIKHRT